MQGTMMRQHARRKAQARVARQPGMAVLVAERHQQNAKVFAMNQIDDAQAILGRVEAKAEAVEAGGIGG